MGKQSQLEKVLAGLRAQGAVIDHAIAAIEAELRERPAPKDSPKLSKIAPKSRLNPRDVAILGGDPSL